MKKKILFIAAVLLIMLAITSCTIVLPKSCPSGTVREAAYDSAKMPSAPICDGYNSEEELHNAFNRVKSGKADSVTMDRGLYNMDYYYLPAKEIPGFKTKFVSISETNILEGYSSDGEDWADSQFMWMFGLKYDLETTKKKHIKRFNLKRYKDTKYYFSELQDSMEQFIFWWENEEHYSFSYPQDSGIAPEDLVEYLEVKKYEVSR